jgi:hypothetical protein
VTSVETEAPEQAASLHVRVPEQLRDAVVEVAVSEQRSIGSATRILLAEALEARAEDGGR